MINKRKRIFIGVFIVLTLFVIKWQGADYLNVRIEGLSNWDSFLSGVSYLRKYRSKKLTTSDSLTAYFKHQNIAYKNFHKNSSDSSIVSIGFVGDLMWIKSNWNNFLSPEVKSRLELYDVMFGNLESPIDTLSPVPGFWPDYQTYNSDPGLIRSFYSEKKQRNIFSALSLANNHCFDRKSEGLYNTMQFLDKEGIKYSGVRFKANNSEPYTLIEENGIRIGYYALCWGVNDSREQKISDIKINILPGIAPLDPKQVNTDEVAKILKLMTKDSIDFKVLSIHWGYEYELYPDLEIMKIAHKLVEFGADLIIGSHPHVIQPDEICYMNTYSDDSTSINAETNSFLIKHKLTDQSGIPRKALIVYSLGNFTTNMFTRECNKGAIQSIKLIRNRLTGKIDWQSPDIQYIYNTDSDPLTGKKKLLMWKDSATF